MDLVRQPVVMHRELYYNCEKQELASESLCLMGSEMLIASVQENAIGVNK